MGSTPCPSVSWLVQIRVVEPCCCSSLTVVQLDIVFAVVVTSNGDS
jgi:hypothetical protein